MQAASPVTAQELTAERWLERGFEASDRATQFASYTEAIRLKPDFALAFTKEALADFEDAIRLQPAFALAFNNRGAPEQQARLRLETAHPITLCGASGIVRLFNAAQSLLSVPEKYPQRGRPGRADWRAS